MAIVLVDLQRVDSPVRILESLRVVLYPFLACSGLLAASAVLPYTGITRPYTAECRVKDDLLLLECFCNVTATLETSRRFSPAAGIRVATKNICRNRAAREEVNTDSVGSPLSRKYASAIGVQTRTIAFCRWILNGTSRIVFLSLGLDVTVASSNRTLEEAVVRTNLATRPGVKRHGIGYLVIDTFDNVNLAIAGPAGTSCPESINSKRLAQRKTRPCTYAGHVPQPTGMCATSKTIKPLSYDFLLVIRTLGRPCGVWFWKSTPQDAPAVIEVLMRFDCLAVFSSTYLTKPSVGSGAVKKSKEP